MALGQNHNWQQLAKTLVQERIFSKDKIKDIFRQAKEAGVSPLEPLFAAADAEIDRVLSLTGEFLKLPTVRLQRKVITPYVINLLPKEVAERHGLVVFKKIGDTIHLAITNPDDRQPIEFVRRHTNLEPKIFLTTPDDLRRALSYYRTELSEDFGRIINDSLKETSSSRESVADLAQHLPIINMVNSVLEKALGQNASDIHFEPASDSLSIRFRVDGLLRKIVTVPIILHAPIIARLKLMANVKIDEHRLPQDGRFSFTFSNREVAVRVSIVPTLNGSKVVLRLLDAKQQQYSLRSLGLNQRDFGIMKTEITKPNGLIIVTGPTGSGKTTTLYTLLRLLNTEDKNICTIEDPIEYGLAGINQTQVNPVAGLTFANGLRSLLRQDPNVIMVGEIRDADTADIAVNAAMTGHLVLTTLHTNSATQTIQRLVEMGVQPYLAASTINVIVAQRLVRKVCRHCRQEMRLTDRVMADRAHKLPLDKTLEKLIKIGLLPEATKLTDLKIAIGRGCDHCQNTGYLGRVGVYCVLPMTDSFHQGILADRDPDKLAKIVAAEGRLSILEDGILKVLMGLTTFDEVIRVTN